jgi:biotin operon repressor
MLGFFSKKKEIEEIKSEVKNSFNGVKEDIEKIGQWVTHLNNNDITLNNQISDIIGDVSSLKDEVEQLKDIVSMFGEGVSKQLFKTNRQIFNKQTAVEGVQTAVQTAVQTGNFLGISNLSTTERAIIWVLANNELKLSYDDLAAMLGKTRSTIRGQINAIKQKSEGLILEYTEKNGRKRVYIPDEIKEKIIKRVKVRVKREKYKKIIENSGK